jgi:hypothetical protein
MSEDQGSPPKGPSPAGAKDDALQKKRVRARQATLVGMPAPTAAELGKKVTTPKLAPEPKAAIAPPAAAKSGVAPKPAPKTPMKPLVAKPAPSEPLATEPTQAAAKAPDEKAFAKTELPPKPAPIAAPRGAIKSAPKPDAPLTPVAVPRSLGMKPAVGPKAEPIGTPSAPDVRPRVITSSKSTEPLATEPTQTAVPAPQALRDEMSLAKTMVPVTSEPATEKLPVESFGKTQEMHAVGHTIEEFAHNTGEIEAFDLGEPSAEELPGEPTQVGAKNEEANAESTRPNVEMPPEPPESVPPPARIDTPPPPAPLPVEPTVVVHPSVSSPAQTYQVDVRSGSVQLAPATDPPPAKKSSMVLWIALGAVALLGIVGVGTAVAVYMLFLRTEATPVSVPLPRDPEPPPEEPPAPVAVAEELPPPASADLPPVRVIPREEMESFQLDRPRMSNRSNRMTRAARIRATARPRQRATSLMRAGQNEQAEAVFREVLTIMPADGDSLEGLALVTMRQGRYPEARAWAQAAVDRTRSANAYRLLGDAWNQAGHADEARTNYMAGRLLHPNDRQLRERLGLPAEE